MPEPSNQPSQQHVWYYRRVGILDFVEEGPFSQSQLFQVAKENKLKLETWIKSPTKTNGQWFEAKSFPPLAAAINQAKSESDAAKAKAAQEKADEKKAAAELARVNAQARIDEKRQNSGEEASESLERVKAQVRGILTNDEQILFAVLQTKPVVIKQDAAVCTTRRLIIYRPKLLGRFEFQDFLWHDLKDVHIKQGIVASTFSAKHVTGVAIELDWLPKNGAQELYRITQQAEEKAFHTRRQMQMEEAQAGAAKINIANTAAPPVAAPTPSDAVDPMARLQKLKQMLEAGLVTADEFERKKKEVLDSI